LAGRDQDVPHARFKGDRNGMSFAGLRDYASVNDHFFGDCFSFQLRNLHVRGGASRLFLFPDTEPLLEPNDSNDDQDEHDRADDDSFFHFVFSAAFIGR
jgi:hypothetical protein